MKTTMHRVRSTHQMPVKYQHIPYLDPTPIESCGSPLLTDLREAQDESESLFSLFIEETLNLRTPRPSFTFFDIKNL